jgi:hypothetical protein
MINKEEVLKWLEDLSERSVYHWGTTDEDGFPNDDDYEEYFSESDEDMEMIEYIKQLIAQEPPIQQGILTCNSDELEFDYKAVEEALEKAYYYFVNDGQESVYWQVMEHAIKQALQDYEQRIKELTNELHVLRDVVEKHCNTYVLKDVSKGCWTND